MLAWDGMQPRLDAAGGPVTRWDGVTTINHPVTGEAVPDPAAPACPLPLVRRPVHFLEHVARSCAREGLPWERERFMASPFWQHAQVVLLEPQP